MSILIFDTPTIQRIKQVVDYGHRHPLSMDDMLDIMNKARKPPGDFEEHVVYLSFGYKCVYSEEQQNVGICKHLSVSLATPGRLPNPGVVEEILPLFDMHTPMHDCIIDIEEFAPGRSAVNVVELPKRKV